MSEYNESKLYVAYYTKHPLGNDFFTQAQPHNQSNKPTQKIESQQQAIERFISHGEIAGKILDTVIENVDFHKKNNKWPKLMEALNLCKTKNASLLIAELGTHTSNAAFTEPLLQSKVSFHCCDQPFITPSTLEPLTKHLQAQRQLHGKLIREGLKLTSAKSGNPNAAEVISKVNKPKIDTAIIFAFLMQHLIALYKRKGYSQRNMVKSLNEVGFTAPEGGKWVLSQLQKVLDRIRLNELATQLKEPIELYLEQNLSFAQIAEALNRTNKSSLKRTGWDATQVSKLIIRHKQIKEISDINQFILSLLPKVQTMRAEGKSYYDMLDELNAEGLSIRSCKA